MTYLIKFIIAGVIAIGYGAYTGNYADGFINTILAVLVVETAERILK